jgi:hypothetical protein
MSNQLGEPVALRGERLLRHIVLVLVALLLAACQQSASGADKPKDGKYMLTITGYNYTDQSIGNFSVNGIGGSDVSVSTPTSGGGGGSCCIVWREGTRLPQKVRIEWDADACEYTSEPNIYGNRFETYRHFYKEQYVELKGPIPKNPGYFEVHFYPDGHIEVAITELFSDPRLKLPSDRERPSRRCTTDELKEIKK